jgi:hypothetical protein
MTLYEEYAILDAQIKELEYKKDVLRVNILTDMVGLEQDKVETSVGSFSIAKLKRWTYPKKVLDLGEKFKAEKAKAESTGEATFTEQESLRFNSIKI